MTVSSASTRSPSPNRERNARAPEARWIGAGLCTLSAAGFATLAILVKLAYAQGMSLFGLLSLRFGGAAVLLVAFLLLRRTHLYFGFRRSVPLFLLGAVGYAMQASLYVGSLQRIPASVAALLLYSYPVFVALLAWVFNHRRPSRQEWAAMGLALIGVILTIGPVGKVGRLDALGLGLVFISAGWYAGYILISERFVRQAGALVSTAWITLGAFCTFTAAGWVTRSLPGALTPAAGWIMAGMILFSTILPIGAFLAGMVRVGPTAAALLSTLEPVFTVLLAAWLLAEGLTGSQLVGGGLVLVAVIVLSLPSHRPGAAPPAPAG
jgi:drug/metabolite transporter (DMT)-like permease